MIDKLNYIPKVVNAKYKGNFTIIIEFDNNVKKEVNCKKFLKGKIFEELKDENNFKNFFVDGITITWPNGADIAPETLYFEGKDVPKQ